MTTILEIISNSSKWEGGINQSRVFHYKRTPSIYIDAAWNSGHARSRQKHRRPQGRTKSQREIGSQVEGVGVWLIACFHILAAKNFEFLTKTIPMIFWWFVGLKFKVPFILKGRVGVYVSHLGEGPRDFRICRMSCRVSFDSKAHEEKLLESLIDTFKKKCMREVSGSGWGWEIFLLEGTLAILED